MMISYLFLSQFSDAFICSFWDPGSFPLVALPTLKSSVISLNCWQTGILTLLDQMQCFPIPPLFLLSTRLCWTLSKCKVLMVVSLP